MSVEQELTTHLKKAKWFQIRQFINNAVIWLALAVGANYVMNNSRQFANEARARSATDAEITARLTDFVAKRCVSERQMNEDLSRLQEQLAYHRERIAQDFTAAHVSGAAADSEAVAQISDEMSQVMLQGLSPRGCPTAVPSPAPTQRSP